MYVIVIVATGKVLRRHANTQVSNAKVTRPLTVATDAYG